MRMPDGKTCLTSTGKLEAAEYTRMRLPIPANKNVDCNAGSIDGFVKRTNRSAVTAEVSCAISMRFVR